MTSIISDITFETQDNLHTNVLPIIPLSPIVKSFIECSNTLQDATERLTKAKKTTPPVPVSTLRTLLETSKLESIRLNSLTQKMQTVEAATAMFWDADALARQIAIVDSELYGRLVLDKRSLTQDHPSLRHFIDFHQYLTHSFSHQLIYWAELLQNPVAASAVLPAVNPNRDSLVAHLVRIAYLLLHAYRDFSGFAALMRALTSTEVNRLHKRLWTHVSSRTKEMFRELLVLLKPDRHYAAYRSCVRQKLDPWVLKPGQDMMVVIPWIQPHLASIRSIVAAYTAGDNDHALDIVLSTPGAHKLDLELAVLALCQHQTFQNTGFALDDIWAHLGEPSKRGLLLSKSIQIEGLRQPVVPVMNLRQLVGDDLIQHWLVSRVYLRKDQLVNESLEVESLRPGERLEQEEEADLFPPVSRRASVMPRPETPDTDDDDIVLVVKDESDIKDAPSSSGSSDRSNSTSAIKSKLSATAPAFVPVVGGAKSVVSDDKWVGYPEEEGEVETILTTTESERWAGYPVPERFSPTEEPLVGGDGDEDEDEEWKGYPVPVDDRRISLQSETSEEWKGYQATKMEADWQRESDMKVKEHEWQGYALETLDEDELDSSTMMNGKFEKSRKARGQEGSRVHRR